LWPALHSPFKPMTSALTFFPKPGSFAIKNLR
jgi:hypothetical protein